MKLERLALSAMAVIVLAVGLSGCSVIGTPTAKEASSSTATRTPTPTPTVLSDAEAARAYVEAICPANKVVNTFNAALQGSDLDALHQAAQAALTADSTAAKTLDTTRWPPDVAVDVATIRDELFSEVSTDSQVLHATDLSQINSIQWPDLTAGSQASARLRSRLNLPVDAMQGC